MVTILLKVCNYSMLKINSIKQILFSDHSLQGNYFIKHLFPFKLIALLSVGSHNNRIWSLRRESIQMINFLLLVKLEGSDLRL